MFVETNWRTSYASVISRGGVGFSVEFSASLCRLVEVKYRDLLYQNDDNNFGNLFFLPIQFKDEKPDEKRKICPCRSIIVDFWFV